MTIGRFITESPNWLAARGHNERAEVAVTNCYSHAKISTSISLGRHTIEVAQPTPSFWALFDRRNCRATEMPRNSIANPFRVSPSEIWRPMSNT